MPMYSSGYLSILAMSFVEIALGERLINCKNKVVKILFPTHEASLLNMSLKLLSTAKSFAGEQRVYSHFSEVLKCEMKLGVYLPPQAIEEKVECPVLYFLSGLTCTHENFIQKSGFQRFAAEKGICVVNPDTSPREVNIPGEDDSYDFGSGAGFYVDAVQDPWAKNYKMYSYVTKELIELINNNLPIAKNKQSIMGHSMGGHGALICALKNPGLYQSVSAFAPICNPIEGAWGQKALKGYIGEDKEEWKKWDATELAKKYSGTPFEVLIDQGTEDNFLKQEQLLPDHFVSAAANNDHLQAIYKLREGYDHSYFYIASFIDEHLNYHAKFLKS